MQDFIHIHIKLLFRSIEDIFMKEKKTTFSLPKYRVVFCLFVCLLSQIFPALVVTMIHARERPQVKQFFAVL